MSEDHADPDLHDYRAALKTLIAEGHALNKAMDACEEINEDVPAKVLNMYLEVAERIRLLRAKLVRIEVEARRKKFDELMESKFGPLKAPLPPAAPPAPVSQSQSSDSEPRVRQQKAAPKKRARAPASETGPEKGRARKKKAREAPVGHPFTDVALYPPGRKIEVCLEKLPYGKSKRWCLCFHDHPRAKMGGQIRNQAGGSVDCNVQTKHNHNCLSEHYLIELADIPDNVQAGVFFTCTVGAHYSAFGKHLKRRDGPVQSDSSAENDGNVTISSSE